MAATKRELTKENERLRRRMRELEAEAKVRQAKQEEPEAPVKQLEKLCLKPWRRRRKAKVHAELLAQCQRR